MDWLTKKLKREIRRVFEPRYGRELTDEEVIDLAQNLVGLVETICQFRHSQGAGMVNNQFGVEFCLKNSLK